MAVVKKYAQSVQNPDQIKRVKAVFAEGVDRTINTGSVAIANGDSVASKLFLGKIHSFSVPDIRSQLYHTAVTGCTDVDIGLEYQGATVDVDVFSDGLNIAAAAGAKNVFSAITTANIGKPIFELLGLTTDPAKEYDIVLTLNAAATADGTISAQISYSK